MPKEADKDLHELKDIEIFSIGTHKGIKYKESDLDEIIVSFNELKDKIKPPLKMAHRNNMHKKDGQPSLGWTSELKKMGGKLLASFSDVPKLVKDAISKKLYKRVSSELYNNLSIGGKKYKRVLAGVGLLGADIPEVKDLQDIEIFFNDNSSIITNHEFDVEEGVIKYTEDNIMDTKELEALFQKKIDLMQAEIDKVKTDSQAALDSQLQKFTEEKSELENKLIEKDRTVGVEEFKSFCESAVKDCKIFPAARDILYNDKETLNFSEENEIVIPFSKFKSFIEKTHEILDKSEHGFHLPTDKRDKPSKSYYTEKPGVKLHDADLDVEVKKYMKENKVEYTEAMTAVLVENPDLAEKFVNTGVKVGGE